MYTDTVIFADNHKCLLPLTCREDNLSCSLAAVSDSIIEEAIEDLNNEGVGEERERTGGTRFSTTTLPDEVSLTPV